MASRYFEKILLHGLTKALFQFFGLTVDAPVGFDTNGQLKNVTGADGIPLAYLDTNTSLTANSDVKVPSQKAVKAFVGTSVALTLSALPTSNPAVLGALWNDAGVLKVSAGA
jgi:hypothetical protein